MTTGQSIAEWWEFSSAQISEHAAKIDAAIEAAVRAERERCVGIAAAEQAKRLENARNADNGSMQWGADPSKSAVIQRHKAVTAGTILAAIQRRYP